MMIVIISFLLLQCKEEPKLKARINRITGKVVIVTNSSTKPASVGDLLLSNDQIRTETDATVDLMFPGGMVIRLKDQSQMTVNELGSQCRLTIENGAILVGSNKLKANESLTVQTPTVVAAVRGTSFLASATDHTIAVYTGQIAVERDGESVVAEPMKQVHTNETKLQTVRLDSKSGAALRELLEIDGIEKLNDFDDLQKNLAIFSLDTKTGNVPVQKKRIDPLQVHEK